MQTTTSKLANMLSRSKSKSSRRRRSTRKTRESNMNPFARRMRGGSRLNRQLKTALFVIFLLFAAFFGYKYHLARKTGSRLWFS